MTSADIATLLGMLDALLLCAAIQGALMAAYIVWARRRVRCYQQAMVNDVREDLRHMEGPVSLH